MRGLWLTAAVATLFAMGCGELGGTDGGSNACSTDANCGTGKVCHPILKECVLSCTSSTDCPSTAKTCARYDGTAGSASAPGFCQCSTDQLCNGGSTGELVCSAATKRCENKCTSNSSCPSGFTCDTASGQCRGGGSDGGSDGGMDAGMDAGVTCNSNNAQPDVCGYGSVCTASNTCEAIVDDRSCPNIQNSGRPAWTSASTGPVIFNVVDEADDQTKCTQDNAFTVTVYAYAGPGSTFPAMKSNLPGFFYYTTNGTAVDIPSNLLQQSNYTLYGNTVMGAKFTLCSTSTTSIVAGFGFTNGNGYCAMLTR
ncbi:MAG: hypothetical protein AB1730_13290 [Myxococcota bacterium]